MSGLFAKMDPRRIQWGANWFAFQSRVLRTKPVESMLETTGSTGAHGTKLARVLSTVDLVSLGVGSCVGTGMYVVSGLVAKEMAGPGVIVSFIIAAVASILSGECILHFLFQSVRHKREKHREKRSVIFLKTCPQRSTV